MSAKPLFVALFHENHASSLRDLRRHGRHADYEGGDAIAMDADDFSMCLVTTGGDILCSHADLYGRPPVPDMQTQYVALGPRLEE